MFGWALTLEPSIRCNNVRVALRLESRSIPRCLTFSTITVYMRQKAFFFVPVGFDLSGIQLKFWLWTVVYVFTQETVNWGVFMFSRARGRDGREASLPLGRRHRPSRGLTFKRIPRLDEKTIQFFSPSSIYRKYNTVKLCRPCAVGTRGWRCTPLARCRARRGYATKDWSLASWCCWRTAVVTSSHCWYAVSFTATWTYHR